MLTNGMSPVAAKLAARKVRRSATRVAAGDWSTIRWALRNLAQLCGPGTDGERKAMDLYYYISESDQDELVLAARSLASAVERA